MPETYQLTCHKCGVKSYKYSTPDLKGSGWKGRGKKAVCPACQGKVIEPGPPVTIEGIS